MRRFWRAVVVLALTGTMVGLDGGVAQAGPLLVDLTTRTDISVGLNPFSVAIGDLNGDGNLDLAVAKSGAVSVLLGDGAGGFGAPTDFATPGRGYSVAMGDLNGDGNLDLASANYGASVSTVFVLLGDGTGHFEPTASYATAGLSLSVKMGDLNGDGNLDLAVANSTVSVLLGDGSGHFGLRSDIAVGGSASSVAIGDVNGDGALDLAATNQSDKRVAVLLGDGTGHFGTAAHFETGYVPTSVAMGDLDDDGNLDLGVTSFIENSVALLLGDGTGSFGPRTDYATGASPSEGSLAMSDLNGDGNLELAVTNRNSDSLSILLGDGTGTFGSRADFATGTDPNGLAVGDLSGDGRPDVVIANESSGTVSVLLNKPGVPTAPSAPTIIRNATAGNASATVSWKAPTSDGGSPVTGYVVTPFIGYYPLALQTFTSTATTQVVSGLTNGTTYRFRVQAVNAIGTGGYSKATNSVTPALLAPSAPTIGSATAGDGVATVSWLAPLSDGGSTITGYVVTPYIGYFPLPPRSFSSTATTQVVTGLVNGTQYRFRVQAVNAIGTGGYSKATNPVTPAP